MKKAVYQNVTDHGRKFYTFDKQGLFTVFATEKDFDSCPLMTDKNGKNYAVLDIKCILTKNDMKVYILSDSALAE